MDTFANYKLVLIAFSWNKSCFQISFRDTFMINEPKNLKWVGGPGRTITVTVPAQHTPGPTPEVEVLKPLECCSSSVCPSCAR